MAPFPPIRHGAHDVLACIGFFTRLPVRWAPHGGRRFADALWAAPLAGVAVAAAGAAAFWLARQAGLQANSSALLALAATMLATGCLHEDGLADVADGFGGGRTPARRLEIMKDSRIGAFGAAALFVALGLRWSALAALASPAAVWWAMAAAHGASRALLPGFLRLVRPARAEGLGADIGAVSAVTTSAALLVGAALLLPLGLIHAATVSVALAAWFVFLQRLAERRIGGQTGDVCGALQQGGEIIVLLAAGLSYPSP